MLVALIFCDLEKRILPDEFTLGGTLIGLVFAAFVPVPDITVAVRFSGCSALELARRGRESLAESALGAVLPAVFLWGGGWLYFKLRHREGLGLGDVKLVAMVGSFLGLQYTLSAMLLGSLAGSVISLLYIWAATKDAGYLSTALRHVPGGRGAGGGPRRPIDVGLVWWNVNGICGFWASKALPRDWQASARLSKSTCAGCLLKTYPSCALWPRRSGASHYHLRVSGRHREPRPGRHMLHQ